jgi:hypothetical protein
MSVVPIHELPTSPGTLVWIGDTGLPEFQSAYEFCVAHAAQIALRPSFQQAAGRPASGVQRVVVARQQRQPICQESVRLVRELYPGSSWIDLLGPLCEGIRESSHSDSRRVCWRRWRQFLPHWLDTPGCEKARQEDARGVPLAAARSVIVIASNWEAAEPYLDLADSCQVTATWSRVADSRHVRNVEAVWWDDSAAPIASYQSWRQRLNRFVRPKSSCPRHAWMTSGAGFDQERAAILAGVDRVIHKPFQIQSLLEMLATSASVTAKDVVAA